MLAHKKGTEKTSESNSYTIWDSCPMNKSKIKFNQQELSTQTCHQEESNPPQSKSCPFYG